jgi:hypothetical protein
VDLADLVTPVATAHRDKGHLSLDDGTTDGGGHLLGTLNTQPNVAVEVANNDKCL